MCVCVCACFCVCGCVFTDESYNDYIKGSLKDGVTYIQRDLMPESRYCVFVNLAANKDSFENFKRKCVDARTGSELDFILASLSLGGISF